MAIKRKSKKVVDTFGVAHISTGYNNTIITITDVHGNVISWASGGSVGFKGARKSTPFAAQEAAKKLGASIYDMGMRGLEVRIYGTGQGREHAVKGLCATGLSISAINDKTPIPHNGPKPPKRRRQ